jgi:hypothetical protein
MPPKLPWLLVGAILALATGILGVLVWKFGLGSVSSLITILGITLASLVSTLATWARVISKRPQSSTSDQLAAAVETLTDRVRDQWSHENTIRGLTSTKRLKVAWTSSQRDVGDSDLALGTFAGNTANEEGLVRSLREDIPQRRLVILGPAGSGKSVLAVLLTLGLIKYPKAGERTPVLLTLSSWDPEKQPLSNWMRRRIREDYIALSDTATYGPTAVADLVAKKVFPILDGLDEIPRDKRGRALSRINEAFAEDEGFIVTCRDDDYQDVVDESGVVIHGAAVVEPESADMQDMVNYLRNNAPGARRHQWQIVFDFMETNPDSPVPRAFSSPLMISMAASIYRDASFDPRELISSDIFPTAEDIEDYLLENLIASLVSQDLARDVPYRSTSWSSQEGKKWLGFLARHLTKSGEHDIRWWSFYRNLPGFANRKIQRFAYVPGAAAWIIVASVYYPYRLFSILTGLAYGLAIAISCMFARAGQAADADASSRLRRVRSRTLLGLLSGLAFGSAIGVRTILSDGFAIGLRTGVADGCIAGLVVVIAATVAQIPSPPEAPARVDFRVRGRLRTLSRTFAVGAEAGIVFGVAEGVLTVFKHQFANSPSLVPGLLFGLLSGVIFGIGSWLVRWTRTPVSSNDAISPRSTLRYDRTQVVVLACLTSATLGTAFGLDSSFQFDALGVVANGAIGLLVGVLSGASPLYYLAVLYLAMAGSVPLSAMSFMEDCYRIGLFRQIGPVYEFRHSLLRDHLALDASARGTQSTVVTAVSPAGRRSADVAGEGGVLLRALQLGVWTTTLQPPACSSIASITSPAPPTVAASRNHDARASPLTPGRSASPHAHLSVSA